LYLGECVGLKQSMEESAYMYSVRSVIDRKSHLFFFELNDFKRMLERKFPEDFEKFCEMRDDILFRKRLLDSRCISCERFGHEFQDCPLIKVTLARFATIARSQHSEEVKVRSSHNRKPRNIQAPSSRFRSNAKEIRLAARRARIELAIAVIPDYGQFMEELLHVYDDKKVALELPEFCLRDGNVEVMD